MIKSNDEIGVNSQWKYVQYGIEHTILIDYAELRPNKHGGKTLYVNDVQDGIDRGMVTASRMRYLLNQRNAVRVCIGYAYDYTQDHCGHKINANPTKIMTKSKSNFAGYDMRHNYTDEYLAEIVREMAAEEDV